jgi:hypothetical protein
MLVPPTAQKKSPDFSASSCLSISQRRIVLLFLLACFTLTASCFARPRQTPESTFHLDTLGFQGISDYLVSQGGSYLTVNFADDTHLLITFETRGLLARHAADAGGDGDRGIAALLLDLPSGKIIARTSWRVHDTGRYLWALGHGRFLLRIGDFFSTFNPALNLASNTPFDRVTFPPIDTAGGEVNAIVVSPDRTLLTIETALPTPQINLQAQYAAAQAAALPHFATNAHAAPPQPPPLPLPPPTPSGPAETLHIFRISGEGTPASPLHADPVATVGANAVTVLPLFADGYLQPTSQSSVQWKVAFHAFSGKSIPLAPLDSSCAPNMYRVSPAQFVSFNCRGFTGNVMLTAYDLAQHVLWEEPMQATDPPPAFALAPAAGRFAISRMEPDDIASATNPTIVEPGFKQTVRIYQTQTGDELLKIDCTPVYKTAENFDLSPDGLRAAVVRNGAIEVYRLAPLTKQDHEDLAMLAALAPPPSNTIDLSTIVQASTITTQPVNPPNTIAEGDPQGPRQRPTLLNPGEKPEFQDPNHSPD